MVKAMSVMSFGKKLNGNIRESLIIMASLLRPGPSLLNSKFTGQILIRTSGIILTVKKN